MSAKPPIVDAPPPADEPFRSTDPHAYVAYEVDPDPESESQAHLEPIFDDTEDADPWHRRLLRIPSHLTGQIALGSLVLLAALFGSLVGATLVYSVDLPQIEDLERYRPIATTELYDVHGQIVGSFALQRRVVVGYDDLPPVLLHAVISIEDKNFEKHWGINLFRVFGAAYRDLVTSNRAQGASTLTMQLARNLFLSADRTFSRKIQEVLLSIQIERHFTKEQIFTLYANQIYLGRGIYGFEAGAQFYFSKHARDLTLPEAALLAGLPKAPNTYSPLNNADRAFHRRNLVINEMLEDGAISAEQANQARNSPLGLRIEPPPNTEAPWFVEEIRQTLEKQYGAEQVLDGGLRVYTTLDLDLQRAANRAMLNGLAEYERRHGWNSNLVNVVEGGSDLQTFHHPDWDQAPQPDMYVHALVTYVLPYQVSLRIAQQTATLEPQDWAWTRKTTADTFLKTGDIVYVHVPAEAQTGPIWHVTLEEDTGAQGALLALDNATGDILAMVGGRNFHLSQFNRSIQAERQTGSSFKPYVYTTAVEEGLKPDDRISDSPVVFNTPSGPYAPHNYDGKYWGDMSVLTAFANSRNIPALRIADRVGIHKVIAMAHRFGLTENIPAYLPVALGSAEVTLLEQASAFSVFPNDGVRVEPRLLRRVTTMDGRILEEGTAKIDNVIDQKTARTMMVLLQEVTRSGTAARASSLKHPFGGKTGTTNDFTDAWMVGFSPSITAGVWMGYDNRQTLGDKESGGHAALPIWMDFMKTAIVAHPEEKFKASAAPRGAAVQVKDDVEAGPQKSAASKPDEPLPAAQPGIVRAR